MKTFFTNAQSALNKFSSLFLVRYMYVDQQYVSLLYPFLDNFSVSRCLNFLILKPLHYELLTHYEKLTCYGISF